MFCRFVVSLLLISPLLFTINTYASSLPTFTSSFSYKGTNYPYTIVGENPLTPTKTWIDAVVVPLQFDFMNSAHTIGKTYDYSTVPDGKILNDLLQSPLFINYTWATGFESTQWVDAILRATFYSQVRYTDYHVLFNPPTLLETIHFPINTGYWTPISSEGRLVGMQVNINYVETLLNVAAQSNGLLEPQKLYIFVMNNIRLSTGAPSLLYRFGYNGAETTVILASIFDNKGAQATNPTWRTLAPVMNSIADWAFNPFLNNTVPAYEWNSECNTQMDIGDVSANIHGSIFGMNITVNGHATVVHARDVALLPWFAHQRGPLNTFNGAYSFPEPHTFGHLPSLCLP